MLCRYWRLFPNTQEKMRRKEGKGGRKEEGERGRHGGRKRERESEAVRRKKENQQTKILNKHYNMLFRKPTGFSTFWK